MKDKFINFRASEKEVKLINSMARKAKMTKADFIRHAIFGKEIVVLDGLKELQKELKRIGNNLNQLTTRSNMGHFQVLNLDETKAELSNIYDRLSELCEIRNRSEQINSEDETEDNALLSPPISSPETNIFKDRFGYIGGDFNSDS